MAPAPSNLKMGKWWVMSQNANVDRVSRKDKLFYVQSMTRELRQLMDAEKMPMMSYLLDMAYIEVSDTIRAEHVKDALATTKRRMAAAPFDNRIMVAG